MRRGGDSHHGKARDHGRGRERTGQLGAANALNMPTSPLPLLVSLPPDRGPVKGRNDLMEKLVLEGRPERTISVWCKSVAKSASETGRRGAGAGASADDGAAPAAGEGEGRIDLDGHVGRRRVSTDSCRHIESLAQ